MKKWLLNLRHRAIPLFVGMILAGLFALALQTVHAQAVNDNLRPEEVLVIANNASEYSMSVARYYMRKRQIPNQNLFTVHFPKQQHRLPISHQDFQEKIVTPLQTFLEQNALKEKILALVTVYDVPYKVSGPYPLVPQLKKQIIQDEELLKEMLAKSNVSAREIQDRQERIESGKRSLKKLEPVWDALVAQQHPDSRNMAEQVLVNHAAVDSELAWLFRSDVYGPSATEDLRLKAYFGRTLNPYFKQRLKFREFRKRSKAAGLLEKNGMLYLTARLEGPSVEISKNLVDLALKAEKEGPRGLGCFDARRSTIGQQKSGYALGEAWVRRAYIETHNAGFETKFDEVEALFEKGACPNTLFYWGWYALESYEDAFDAHFAPGAFAVHTASGEASDIRHFKVGGGNPWCAGLLAHGVAFCSGPISEPFLDAFPHADLFYPRLFQGWSAGEAYWAAQAFSSWMMVMIGDPLYTPFSGKNERTHYTLGRIEVRESGQRTPVAFLLKNKQYDVVLFLKAKNSIFKSPATYKITQTQTSISKPFQLIQDDKVRTRVIDNNSFLIVQGMQLETGDFDQAGEVELEITINLGSDGGEKIVSQFFRLQRTRE